MTPEWRSFLLGHIAIIFHEIYMKMFYLHIKTANRDILIVKLLCIHVHIHHSLTVDNWDFSDTSALKNLTFKIVDLTFA